MNPTCKLSQKSCSPCKGGVPPLRGDQLTQFHAQLKNGWQIIEEDHLEHNGMLDLRFDLMKV